MDINVPYGVGGVYCISHKHKLYIGYSNNIWQRLYNHRKCLIEKRHKNYKLQQDWDLDNRFFYCGIIEVTDDRSREEYWIQHFQSHILGYNISLGNKHAEETKQKIHNTNSSDDKVKYFSSLKIGSHLSEETKQKLRVINLGKHLSLETRNKMSNSFKGRKYSQDTINKRKITRALNKGGSV